MTTILIISIVTVTLSNFFIGLLLGCRIGYDRGYKEIMTVIRELGENASKSKETQNDK